MKTPVEFVAHLRYSVRPYLKEPTCIIRTNSVELKSSAKLVFALACKPARVAPS